MSAIVAAGTASTAADIIRAVSTLAWPLLVVVAVILLRGPLGAAIGRLNEVDVGNTKILLQRQAESAANTAKAVSSPAADAIAPPAAITAAATAASQDPAGSVLTAWDAVEEAIRPAARAAVGSLSPTVVEVLNSLTGRGVNDALVPAAQSLSLVRDAAAKSPKAISPAAATSFVSAANDIIGVLRNVNLGAGKSQP